ncbi:arylacetamide deacetylase-like 4 [Elgaria multicarinata webbii]|uniref:arylacetamide deacetylase-like 4 n=1 Tax=Elgaria multicarinata webbii TaxID=159646 RepID=UPI002FCD5060
MDFLWALLAVIAELGALFGLLFLAWTTLYYLSTAEFPHDICEPHKLKCVYFGMIMLFSMDYVLWKIGLCNEYSFVKFMEIAFPPFQDPNLSIKHLHIEGIPVRLYQSKPSQTAQRGILFIHGGAGTLGSIGFYERMCRYISKESESVVLSVGYTLAPEQLYPVQFQECLDVAIHFMKHAEDYGVDPDRIIISGDSFGGLLAASVCQMIVQRDDVPKLHAQILIYPILQAVKYTLPSHRQNAHVPLLIQRQIVTFALHYLQKNVTLVDITLEGAHVPNDIKMKYSKWLSPDNIPEELKVREIQAPEPRPTFGFISELIDQLCGPLLSPLLVDDAIIRKIPQTFILTNQYDSLRDDGILYRRRLEDNGVPVSWHHLEDGFHGNLSLFNYWLICFSCSKTGMGIIVNYIRSL